MLVALAVLVIVIGAVRNHGSAADAATLLGLLALTVWIARWLWIDFRAHPAGFPEPTPSHGLRISQSRDRQAG